MKIIQDTLKEKRKQLQDLETTRNKKREERIILTQKKDPIYDVRDVISCNIEYIEKKIDGYKVMQYIKASVFYAFILFISILIFSIWAGIPLGIGAQGAALLACAVGISYSAHKKEKRKKDVPNYLITLQSLQKQYDQSQEKINQITLEEEMVLTQIDDLNMEIGIIRSIIRDLEEEQKMEYEKTNEEEKSIVEVKPKEYKLMNQKKYLSE